MEILLHVLWILAGIVGAVLLSKKRTGRAWNWVRIIFRGDGLSPESIKAAIYTGLSLGVRSAGWIFLVGSGPFALPIALILGWIFPKKASRAP